MTLSDFDWSYLRRYTLWPAISTVTAVLALVAAYVLHGDRLAEYQDLSSSQYAMHEDYDALVTQRRIVDRYHRRYKQFDDNGFIGQESRLDWVESLRLSAATLALPSFNYSIEPQLAVTVPAIMSSGGAELRLRVSRTQLELNLLHELDLLRFFDELQRRAPGLLAVDGCTLEHIGDVRGAPGEPNLAATCVVEIYSVATADVANEGFET